MNKSAILTTREAAAYLGISVFNLYNKAQNKIIPGVKIGKTWRFKKEDLAACQPTVMDMTVNEVADFMGISVSGVNYHLRKGNIPARKVNNKWLVRRDDLYLHVTASVEKTPTEVNVEKLLTEVNEEIL